MSMPTDVDDVPPIPLTQDAGAQRRMAGDILKLASGATLAQLLTILLSPIISRLFGPDDFGVASVFTSLLTIISLVACLRYELAIVLPEQDDEAGNLLVGSLGISLVIAVLAGAAIWLGGSWISGLLREPRLASLLWLLPIAVLINGVYLALRYWQTRKKRFGLLSGMRVASSLSNTTIKIAAGAMGLASPIALVGSNVVGNLVAGIGLLQDTWRRDSQMLRQARWPTIWRLFRQYRKFPLLNSWSALLLSFSKNLPYVLFAAYYATADVGHYSFALRMIQLPISLVGAAIGQVFLQRASAQRQLPGRLSSLHQRMAHQLITFGALPLTVVALIGPELFLVVFGSAWTAAGRYASILAPSLFMNMLVGTLPLFTVLEKQGVGLLFGVLLFAVRVLPIVIGGWLEIGLPATLTALNVSIAVGWAAVGWWQFSATNAGLGRALIHFGKTLLQATPTCVIIAAAKWLLDLEPLWICIIALLACLPYGWLVWRHQIRRGSSDRRTE